METKPIGLYVHIPFCVRKCNYCDFASEALSVSKREKYIDSLLSEIESYKDENISVDTVFFGGGTPTSLDASELLKIIEKIKKCFDISGLREFTVECNPGTVDLEKLEALKSAGVNRLSFGVQSIHENELKILGRIHSYDDFLESYKLAKTVGFDNISVDLMYGIPEQTKETFAKTIDAIVALAPSHISVYGLIIEEGTPFFVSRDKLALPSEDDECYMYYYCAERLKTLGYEHYEISNYAKEGRRSLHNLKYWRDEEYIGLGLSAHSYYNGKRYFDPESFLEYFDGLWAKYRRSENAFVGVDPFEYAMLGLRLSDGIDLSEYQNKFGSRFAEGKEKLVNDYIEAGLMTLADGRLSLTDKGFYLSNSILSDLL